MDGLTLAHADAATRTALLATGDGMLATWTGTAYDVYYFFTLVTLAVLAILMLRSSIFSRATAVWGLVSAVLMTVPTNFGPVGMAFAVASLAPFSVFAFLVWRRLLQLAGPRSRRWAQKVHQGGKRPGQAESPSRDHVEDRSACRQHADWWPNVDDAHFTRTASTLTRTRAVVGVRPSTPGARG